MKPTLGHILVFAPDLDRARRFYGDVLGLSLERATESYLSFSGADFTLAVFACEGDTPPEGHSARPGVAISFEVTSLEDAIEELAAKGVRFLHERPVDGPLGRYVAFTDPFGTVYELVEAN